MPCVHACKHCTPAVKATQWSKSRNISMSTQLNVLSPVIIVGTLVGLVILAIGWFWLVRLLASAIDSPLNPSGESRTQVQVDTSSLASSISTQPSNNIQTTVIPSSNLLSMGSEQKVDHDQHVLLEAPKTTSLFIETTLGKKPRAEETKSSASSLPQGAAATTTALASTGTSVLATSGTSTAETATIILSKQRPWQLRQPQPLRRRQPLGKQTIHSLRIRG